MTRIVFAGLRAFVFLALVAGVIGLARTAPATAAPLSDEAVARYSRDLVFGSGEERAIARKALVARGETDIVPTVILAMRYTRRDPSIVGAFQLLTGSEAGDWFDAMLWQEAHPEIIPHPSFREIKADLFSRIDEEFLRFIGGERSLPEKMKIRFEEITWGGVPVDGIPSLDNPRLIDAAEADYLADDDLVFGVAINGDVRAYPLRIMGWHEMFNEVIGGVPVALAYCTLCGAAILFETQAEGRAEPLVFGSSGFLYRSNKLMFDRQTDSLWNQFTGEPVSGPLVESGIKLKIRPVSIASWENWKARHPDSKVLSLKTGHDRNYSSGYVYNDYFASPDLMFPARVAREDKLARKDYVFGIRGVGAAKAWPVEAFKGSRVINDKLGNRALVLIGDAATRTVRAYERKDAQFALSDEPGRIAGPGGLWEVREDYLQGPDGARLSRVAGHIAYWFAWDSYLGVKSELYMADAS